MSFATRKTLAVLGAGTGVVVLAAVGFVWSGVYDIGADEPHWPATHALLETFRQRSIDVRAGKLQVPSDLANPDRVRQGAGNYAAMCAGCHLSPGVDATEMSKGLYPSPPDLTKQAVDEGRAFWAIKHGIKASGMPAWGKSMDDEYIWNMAAFIQELPKLDAASYQTLVDSSGGHSHGGGEARPHEHGDSETAPHEHHEEMPREHHDQGDADHHADAPTPMSHSHPPGTPPHQDAPEVPPDPRSTPSASPTPTAPESHDEPHDHHPPF
ncbi:c-type cytochrome [Aerolutibacter ruishenii]|uniref:Mono/diheme cytochrome c family protein n=1 Tax=Aerolutibacter ruishenii TaxID=686800 RepID=A0A562LV84_9GAMM|nr:cytochrome c [Lysobacter ruishenii]TWI11516.1 mono/diheme cytochrome c family protein [Lysobacter ruishenii]